MGIFSNRNKSNFSKTGGLQRVVGVHVEGMKPLIRALQKLPDVTQRRVLRPALSKSSTPIVKAAKKFAPRGKGLKPGGTKRPHLRQTITKTAPKFYRKWKTMVCVIGPKDKASPHSHLVHDGTRAHPIKIRRPLLLKTKSRTPTMNRKGRIVNKLVRQSSFIAAGTVIRHPGSKGVPFLALAVRVTRSQSFRILRREIGAGLEREAAKLGKQGAAT